MRWLYFLARLAFICNIFFLLSVLFRFVEILDNQTIIGFIAIVGLLMAPILNLVFNLSFIVTYYRTKEPINVPGYVLAFNIFIQVAQLIYFII